MIDDFETILMQLNECHLRWPLLRFGQLLENVLSPTKLEIFYTEDDVFIEGIETYLEMFV